MDNDRTEGSMKNIKGRVKEGVGKAIGDFKSWKPKARWIRLKAASRIPSAA